mgnify:CR=1 FL=1
MKSGQREQQKRQRRIAIFALVLLIVMAASVLLEATAARAQEARDIAFPVVTHYPAPSGTEAAPRREIAPAYGVYNNAENDDYAPTRQEVELFVAKARVLMRGARLLLLNDFAQAQEGIDAVQVVNNVPVEGALYTLFLPPGWNRAGNYPVVLSGNGAGTSNNRRLYGGQEIYAPVIAWNATREGRNGVILAVSNCGGTESQGVDEKTLRSVGAFFDFIAQHGGDRHNAVTTGGSRGGGTALVWAANPLDLDYTVRAVFAHVPPTHYGSLGLTSILTYPALGTIAELVGGEGASRFDAGPETMETRLPDVLEILLGARDVEAANARSPVGVAERLRDKVVVISEGTHDSFFQFALFLAFDRHLNALGIDHATAIILGDGHGFSDWVYDQTLAYLNAITAGRDYQPPSGRFYFIKDGNRQVALSDYLGRPVAELPFTVELPARSGAGLPIDVSACGGVGRAWRVAMTGPDGEEVWAGEGVFDETECATFRLETPAEPGVYGWTFRYGGEGIAPTNTPFRDERGCGVPAETVVTAAQPTLDDMFYRRGSLGFGIDQFIAQAEGCN